MNKPPAFQFYAQDFLTGVMYLNNEQKGVYITLLAKQWTDGSVPIKRVGLLVGKEWSEFSEELKEKFDIIEGNIINKRLEKERQKKKTFLKKQSENGKKGGRPSKKINPNKPKPLKNKTQIKPLEEEYEKEIEEEYENLKIKKVENSKLIDKYGIEGVKWIYGKLSSYKLSSGKKYKSDYGAINSWVGDKWEKEQQSNNLGKPKMLTDKMMQDHGIQR